MRKFLRLSIPPFIAMLLAAAVAVVPPAGNAAAASTIYYNGAGSAPQISVVGDSTIAALRWTGQFEPLKRFNYVYDAESCRRILYPSCRGREGYAPDTVVQTMRRLSGQLGSVFVIMGGYDDSNFGFSNGVDAVMAEASRQGIPTVLWLSLRASDVSYVGPGSISNSSTFRANNRTLYSKAIQYGPRLQIADWATLLGQPPGVVLLRRDPLPAGRSQRRRDVHRRPVGPRDRRSDRDARGRSGPTECAAEPDGGRRPGRRPGERASDLVPAERHRRRADHRLRGATVVERRRDVDLDERRLRDRTIVPRHPPDQRRHLPIPRRSPQLGRMGSGEQRRVGHATGDHPVRSPIAGGDGRFRPGPPDLERAEHEWWPTDHRLRGAALVERRRHVDLAERRPATRTGGSPSPA